MRTINPLAAVIARLGLGLALLAALAQIGLASDTSLPGVPRVDRAWQNYVLNCQGCHRSDGEGDAKTTPPLKGMVAHFTRIEGGREYLVQVPGVATSPIPDEELAELLNWMLWRFDRIGIAEGFPPYSGAEVSRLRGEPLRTEAASVRDSLISRGLKAP